MSAQRITFEDHGQDFLFWTIDAQGVVIDCGPFQAWLWNGTKVHNRRIRRGDLLNITPKGGNRTTLRYRVASVRGASR